MYDHKLSSFEEPITVIHSGEYLISEDDIIISTVLGSCIAVSLWDPVVKKGGLNHFMLPGAGTASQDENKGTVFSSDAARYGMYAMELLINALLQAGCSKSRLQAKLFGGSVMFSRNSGTYKGISQSNIDFARNYLETERIPVISSDLGGTQARKIFFFVKSGKVLLKRISGSLKVLVEKEENSYLTRITKNRKEGSINLFD